MNKSSLIDAVRTERARLDALLAGMNEAQLTRPGAQDDWSVKDIIAHLTFWERGMVDNLKRALRGEEPRYPPGELDEVNARVFAENRRRPLAEVLADSRRTSQELLEQLDAFPEADLFDASRFATEDGRSLGEYAAGESVEHYQEHIAAWQGSANAGKDAS